jgi:hypothetical protein
LQQFIFQRQLQDDHQSAATVKYRGYPAQMFWNGESHLSTYRVPYQISCHIVLRGYIVNLTSNCGLLLGLARGDKLQNAPDTDMIFAMCRMIGSMGLT